MPEPGERLGIKGKCGLCTAAFELPGQKREKQARVFTEKKGTYGTRLFPALFKLKLRLFLPLRGIGRETYHIVRDAVGVGMGENIMHAQRITFHFLTEEGIREITELNGLPACKCGDGEGGSQKKGQNPGGTPGVEESFQMLFHRWFALLVFANIYEKRKSISTLTEVKICWKMEGQSTGRKRQWRRREWQSV